MNFVFVVYTSCGFMPLVANFGSVVEDAINGTCQRRYANGCVSYDYGDYSVLVWKVATEEEVWDYYAVL